jgi:hypothetical protein
MDPNQLAKAIIDIAAADPEQADPEKQKDGQREDATRSGSQDIQVIIRS